MSDFKQRLQEEQHELSEKIQKLNAFIENPEQFSKANENQQALLKIQINAMMTYNRCLIERLQDLVSGEPNGKES